MEFSVFRGFYLLFYSSVLQTLQTIFVKYGISKKYTQLSVIRGRINRFAA
jgi:hypothetical protein